MGGLLGALAIAVLTVVRTPTLTLFLLPGIVHMMIAAGSFLVRDTPQRKEQDPVGRIVLYAVGFGVFGFVQIATSFRPEWLAVFPRRLRDDRALSSARHPIYRGGCLAYFGLSMTHPTVPLAIALTGWAVCIGMRMRYEEAILTPGVPLDYAEYRRRVGALVPWPAG